MQNKPFFTLLLLLAALPLGAQTDTLVSKTPQNRAVLLEEYTGVRCSNCPDGHRIANQLAERYPNRFYAVNIHTGSYAEPYATGEPDFRTAYGETLAQNAGVESLPSGVINRHVFQGSTYPLSRNLWAGYTEACLELPAYANIAGRASFDWQTRELSVEVQVFFTDNVPVEANHIHIMLLQNDIIGSQKNASANPAQNLGNNRYRHMHALRDIITDLWGDELTGAAKGGFVSRTYTKRLPERIRNIELVPADLSLVVFLTEDRNEVINVAEAPISVKNGPEHLFAFQNGFQATHRSCDADVRAGFTVEKRTYGGETIREIGFRVEPTGADADASEFTVAVSDSFGYHKKIEVISEPFPLRHLNAADTVEVSVCSVNGQPYGYDRQKTLRIPVAKSVAYTAEPVVEVHLWQDMFGSETQWTFHNDKEELLSSGGPYEDLASIGVREHTTTVTLSEGCHTFKITDTKGDGIHNLFGDGHVSLSTPSGTVLAENDGRFGDSAFIFLKKSGVTNERPASDIGLALASNPVNDRLHLKCRHEIQKIRIFNLRGQEIRCISTGLGSSEAHCSVANLSPGLYLLQVQTTAGSACTKFVVR